VAKQSVTKEAPIDIQKSITPELQAKVEQRLTERSEKKTERAPVFQCLLSWRHCKDKSSMRKKFDKRLIKWNKGISCTKGY